MGALHVGGVSKRWSGGFGPGVKCPSHSCVGYQSVSWFWLFPEVTQ